MAKRKAIGDNPLDTLFGNPSKPEPAPSNKPDPVESAEDIIEKQRVTLTLSKSLIDKARNAVYWTPGLTLTALTEEALATALEQLEQNRGNKFPQREGELRPGRPVY